MRPSVIAAIIGSGAAPGAVAPSITTQAAATGTPTVGVALTFSAATATGTPTPTLAYDLLAADGTTVLAAGISSGSYTPTTAATGLRIRTTASNASGSVTGSSATFDVAAAASGGTARTFDLTASVPAEITVSAPARTVLVNGVLTALSAGTPAIESWGGTSRGLLLHPSISNLVLQNWNMSDGRFAASGSTKTVSGGVAGPDGTTLMARFAEAATTALHHLVDRTSLSAGAGSRVCVSAFIKLAPGSGRRMARISVGDYFNDPTHRFIARIDEPTADYAWTIDDTTKLTNTTFGVNHLGGGLYRLWVTGSLVTSAQPLRDIRISLLNMGTEESGSGAVVTEAMVYTGSTAAAFDLIGLTASVGATQPGPHIRNTTTAGSVAAATAMFSDTSWFASAQGTLIVHHDCWEGPLIGSGAAEILTATAPGKSAIAWDGTGASVCHNGEPVSSASTPAFTAGDLRLLATNAVQNGGHVSYVQYVPTRMTDLALRNATRRRTAYALTPGAWMVASTRNRFPSHLYPLTTQRSAAARMKCKLPAGYAHTSLRMVMCNVAMPSRSLSGFVVGAMNSDAGDNLNAVTIESVRLERGASFHNVTFGGSTSTTIAAGQSRLVSDPIAPSVFGLSSWPANEDMWLRVRYSVTTSGHSVPGNRRPLETGEAAFCFDPAATTVTDTGTGAFTTSGAIATSLINGWLPVVEGIPDGTVTAPLIPVISGDSIMEANGFNHVSRACEQVGCASLEISRGGSSHLQLMFGAAWRDYLPFCNLYLDENGTNEASPVYQSRVYEMVRAAGIQHIHKVGLYPQATSTDGYATAANQTVAAVVPVRTAWTSIQDLYRAGYIEGYFEPLACVEDPTPGSAGRWKWKAGAGYCLEASGVHPNESGQLAMVPETVTYLQSIRL